MTKHGKDMSVDAKDVIIQLIESRHMTKTNTLNKSTISNCLMRLRQHEDVENKLQRKDLNMLII